MNYLNLRFIQSTFFGITLISASYNNIIAMDAFLNKFAKAVGTKLSKNGNESLDELLKDGAQNDIATFYSRIINVQAAACLDIFDEGGSYSDLQYKSPAKKALEYIQDRLAIAQNPRIIALLENLAEKDIDGNLTKAIHNAWLLHNTFLEDSLHNAMWAGKDSISNEERIAFLNAHQVIMDRMRAHNTLYKQACYYCGYVGIDLRSLVQKTGLFAGCAVIGGAAYALYKLYTKHSTAHQERLTA